MDIADPIQYPTVNLGGQTVEVKFRVGDIIRLKKEHHIDITERGELKGVEAFERTVTLLHAGIAHAKLGKTVEELQDLIDLADVPLIARACGEALGKVSPQAKKMIEQMQSETKPNGAEKPEPIVQ